MKIKRGRIALLAVFLLIAITVFAALRSPYVSNYLKKNILQRIESATGYQVMVEKMHANAFPLYVEARGIKAYDENQEMVLSADKVKIYVGLSAVFSREVDIPRIVLTGVGVSTDAAAVKKIREKVSSGGGGKSGGWSVHMGAVELRDGSISYFDEERMFAVEGRGLNAEAVLRNEPEITFSAAEISFARHNWHTFTGGAEGRVVVEEDKVEVKRLSITPFGARLTAEGTVGKDGSLSLDTEMKVPESAIIDAFGLDLVHEGELRAKGSIKAESGFKEASVDMDVGGEFSLKTLMAFLGHADLRVSGEVTGSGNIKGPFKELSGEADVEVTDGDAFGFLVDKARGHVVLADWMLYFNDIDASVYGGKAKGTSTLMLSSPWTYTLDVEGSGLQSAQLLGRSGVDFKMPQGSVSGTLHYKGVSFEPHGIASYAVREGVVAEPENVVGRIRSAAGTYSYEHGVLAITNATVATELSRALWEGDINFDEKTLDIESVVVSTDVSDLSGPYFMEMTGGVSAGVDVSGTLDDPVISVRGDLSESVLAGYRIGDISAKLSYRKKRLDVNALESGPVSITGGIDFPDAETIFELKDPVYDLAARIKGFPVQSVLSLVKQESLPLSGKADGTLKIGGKGVTPVLSGDVTVSDASAYGYDFDSAAISFAYREGVFTASNINVGREGQAATASGHISKDGFSFDARMKGLELAQFVPENVPLRYVITAEAHGEGTMEHPLITAKGSLEHGSFKGKDVGKGSFSLSLDGKTLSYNAKLHDGRLALNGTADLQGNMQWRAELDILPGRYDYLLMMLLQEDPGDLLLSIDGKGYLWGDRNKLYASVTFRQINVSMYGQSFASDREVEVIVQDRNVRFSGMNLKSGNTSFGLSGSLDIGQQVDLVIEGKSSLAPYRALFKELSVLRGNAQYVFSLAGPWDGPKLNGGITLEDASIALKGAFYRFSDINAYVYVDEDRVVIDSFSSRVGGGDVEMKGFAELKGFGVDTYYLDLILSDVSLSPRKDLSMNFGGNLIFKGTADSSRLVGEVMINRARYTERLDWKSWLLKARRMEVPKAPAGRLAETVLNIKVYGPDNIMIDNNIARSSLKVDITLAGTLGSPLLLGRLESREGEVYFRNNDFDIVTATADFADPVRMNPVIDIMAQTSVKGYDITLSLEGQIDRFDLTLTSDPHLDEVEILALLTSGEFGEGLQGLEGGIGAAEATAFLTGQIQDVLEERLSDITGLDRIQIDPYVSKTTGTVTPRVTMSKRLFSDKLYLTYSAAVGTEEEQVIKIEYELNNNISLVGLRDERASMGGDIKFRFEFR